MKFKISLFLLLLAVIPSAKASKWYVNVITGDDNFDASSPTYVTGLTGPKKSIGNTILAAAPYDTIYISEGLYEENVVVDRPLVIRGNNWGINPLTQVRNLETFIVPLNVSLGIGVAGNSLIEITSCCVEIDGIKLQGDNPNINNAVTKYGKEFEISYGIGGLGSYLNNLHITNLIISNFAYSGISLSSGVFSTKSNKIDNCRITTGEQNSDAILMGDNFYSDINYVTIDSVNKGLTFNNYSDKNKKTFTISYLNIHAEMGGIVLNNFNGNTDSLILEYNILNPFDPNIDFTGITLSDILSKGYANISNNIINDAFTGLSIKNYFDLFNLDLSNNSFTKGKMGINIEQSIITPSVMISIKSCDFKNLDSAAIVTLADGDLLDISLTNVIISNSANGVILLGNSNISPSNTQFDQIKRYYLFLDSSSSTGLRPINKIDATSCFYDGSVGSSLNKKEGFAVEDKIRHYLDRNKMAWVLFKDQNLYVTARDGNYSLNPAVKVASNNWNIFLDSINSNENVVIDKTIHLYTHPACGIGKLKMFSKNETLFLHGKLYLSEGLELVQGIIETTPSDTLIVYRSNSNTVLSAGNTSSYVRGPMFIRYINLPVNYVIIDSVPLGLGDDYRPVYINATWPAGLIYFDMGFKSFNGTAPLLSLPSGITHISDIRYWQITNPFNQSGFTFNNVGVLYDSLTLNDLVNDPVNLRMVYRDAVNSYNLGGSGNTAKKGSIMSTSGTPGFGFYAIGNADGGNNILSMDKPIAILNTIGHCSNDSIILSASNSRSDSAIVLYEWSVQGPSTVLAPETVETIKKKISVAGDYIITVIVTNKKGFTDTATKTITIDGIPTMSYTSKSPCFPLPVEVNNTSTLPPLTTIAATEWKIDTTVFTTNDLNYTPAADGLVKGRLKITLNNGCSDTVLFSVLSPVAPQITLIPHELVDICNGDSTVININKSAGIVIWNDGQNYDSLILKTITFKKATIYNSPQCFRSDSVSTNILSKPTVNAGTDLTTLPGKPVNIKATSDAMVEWIPDTWLNDAFVLNPTSRPLLTTQYVLRAYNTFNSCEATDTMTVFVNSDNTSNVPNLLTPNGDGHNDVWVLSNIPSGETCDVYVFTREGQLVFSATSYKNGWDGTRDSVVLPDGYYVFVIENKTTGKVQTGILNILK